MASAFDQLASRAHVALQQTFGSAITMDGVDGTAIVIPQDDMMLGNTVEMINGAHLMFRAADFPDAVVRAEVLHGDTEYLIVEIDDVDSAGIRKARMAPA
ncbi:MAG: hypothetical protein RL661_920 [Pseudomonadota bacterium]|jgi:hypothetical protein